MTELTTNLLDELVVAIPEEVGDAMVNETKDALYRVRGHYVTEAGDLRLILVSENTGRFYTALTTTIRVWKAKR